MKTIMLSGGFDPIHEGHLKMFKAAKVMGYAVIVVVNSDKWLLKKKGYLFQTLETRMDIIKELKSIDQVYPALDADGTVCESLLHIQPDFFGNGGDRTSESTPEKEFCKTGNIEMIYGLGGFDKPNSSSSINIKNRVERPWGYWEVLSETANTKTKILHVEAGKSLSMQKHKFRDEHWTVLEGFGSVILNGDNYPLDPRRIAIIEADDWHQLKAHDALPITILEIQIGKILEESDIERKE